MDRYCIDLQNEPIFVGTFQAVLPKITKNYYKMVILQRQFLGCCGFQRFQTMTIGKLINSTIFLYPI